MAIGARISPVLLVVGQVNKQQPQNYDGQYTGTRVEVETAGGPVNVKFRPDADPARPEVGRTIAVVASVYDGANGSTITFERYANVNDLAEIEATFGAPVKA
jgi:hypothetical protein